MSRLNAMGKVIWSEVNGQRKIYLPGDPDEPAESFTVKQVAEATHLSVSMITTRLKMFPNTYIRCLGSEFRIPREDMENLLCQRLLHLMILNDIV